MQIAQKLRAEGFKVTPQRLAIYQALHEFDKHPNAETIYRNLHPSYPTMSLATVYKTMEIFEKIGLVRILSVGGDSCRYDYDVSPHPHIRCTVCGRVDDLHGIDIDAMHNCVHELSDYEVLSGQIAFDGICPKCLRRKKH